MILIIMHIQDAAITKHMLLARLNDPLLKTHAEVAKELGCDINILYAHKNLYRICKKNGTHISLDK